MRTGQQQGPEVWGNAMQGQIVHLRNRGRRAPLHAAAGLARDRLRMLALQLYLFDLAALSLLHKPLCCCLRSALQVQLLLGSLM